MSKDDNFTVIEYHMLKRHIFVPLASLSTFTVQSALYPLVLVRTRLQLQETSSVYRGLTHAFKSILKREGVAGLYSGYFVKCFQVFAGASYACVYESVRQHSSQFTSLGPAGRSFIGGAAASMVSQTLVVPIDVISQQLMVLSKVRPHDIDRNRLDQVRRLTPLQLTDAELSSSWSRFRAVTSNIFKSHGISGFYKGYLISLASFVPSSALWWAFYDKYCRVLAYLTGNSQTYSTTQENSSSSSKSTLLTSRLAIQVSAAPLAGVSAALLVNPIDCVRVRMQISHSTFLASVKHLWAVEGYGWFTKGLSARLIQSSNFSFWIVLFYEQIKVISLKDEYRGLFISI